MRQVFAATVFSAAPLSCIDFHIMTKPTDERPAVATQAPEDQPREDLASAARKPAGRSVWMGTAVGIGSAAIVAALLYANKKRG